MSVLSVILADTRAECARLGAALPPDLGHRPLDVPGTLCRGAGGALPLIAEIKHRSPSAGSLSRALRPAARARAYAAAGARMISVLVDRAHFEGGYADLAEVRGAVDLPLLAKGFTIEPIQLEAARRAGADAVLLIVRLLPDSRLAELHAACLAKGMTPIVEVCDEAELTRALALGPRVVGVNARDLDTLAMDAGRARRVVAAIPQDGSRALWFSGIGTPAAAQDVAELSRVDAALVGEALMRVDDPSPLLQALVAAARPTPR